MSSLLGNIRALLTAVKTDLAAPSSEQVAYNETDFCTPVQYVGIDTSGSSLLADDDIFGRLIQNCQNSTDLWLVLLEIFGKLAEVIAVSSVDEPTSGWSGKLARDCFHHVAKLEGMKLTSWLFAVGRDSVLPDEAWQDHRDVTMAWFEAGLPICRWHPASSMSSDKEVFLLVAERCVSYEKKVESFRYCSSRLMHDKGFMMKVIEMEPSLYFEDFFCLREDFDVAALAIAKLGISACLEEADQRFLHRLYAHLEKEAGAHQSFKHIRMWGASRFQHFDSHLWGEIREFLGKRSAAVDVQTMQHASQNLVVYLDL